MRAWWYFRGKEFRVGSKGKYDFGVTIYEVRFTILELRFTTMKLNYIFSAILLAGLMACTPPVPSTPAPPNILIILADDLGYGDLGSYNDSSKIPTPHLDQFATQSMRFTDAHSPSAVCTPTRYGVMTGRYCWRSNLPTGVVQGYGPAVIQRDRTTVAALLQQKGYHTAVVGKWHLGVDWAIKGEEAPIGQRLQHRYTAADELAPDTVDFSRAVHDGPAQHGFDYSWILPASLDMQPYCYLENNELVTQPTDITPGNDLNTGYTEAFWREGKIAPDFDFYQVMPTFLQKSIDYITERAQQEQPFFLYLPLASPHTPWVATPEFQGTTEVGNYGDFVSMVDASVGELLTTLETLGIAENTLVIFTSDNGPYWRPNMIEKYGHKASGNLRGMKADIWDGGHRVPFIVRWPGQVEAGSQSDQLIGLTDILATTAAITSSELPATVGEDSYNFLPVLLGESGDGAIRETIIHQSSKGHMAIRKGKWKLIPKRGSGGFSAPRTYEPQEGEAMGQLYDMEADPSESNNLYDAHPEIVAELSARLTQDIDAGFSRKMH